ncbi:MAG: hypothetical protein HXS44_09600 [Theionarchaea archaeon]|nr:hypothetical protein [Theionarchaea archaeon]
MVIEQVGAFIVGYLIGFLPVMAYGQYRYWRRKKIQETIVKRKADILEKGHWFRVRYSSEDRFHSWFKWFPWEGTGILFMDKESVTFFCDMKEWNYNYMFIPENSKVKWIGRSIWRNGLAYWFAVIDPGENHYFTSETGLTIFGSKKSTQEIYDELKKIFSDSNIAQ